MKIAHVCPEYYPAIGGVGQVVRELAERQVALGNEVHVYTSDWDKEKRLTKLEEDINGVKIHRCKHWFRAANFMTFWPGLFPKLFNEKFDLIHSHLFAHPHFVLSALAAKIKKIPHIHTTHCPWSDAPRSFVGKLGILFSYNSLSRLSLKSTSKIIAITPWENQFIKKYGGSSEKTINLPNGMSKIFFKKIKNNDFKRKNKINGKMVLFFGRLSFTKSPDRFVEIAKEVLKERKDVTFVLRGPDEGLRKKVKEMIKGEKNIILLPETRDREEVAKTYQAADICVMPSYREGLPLTLFEMMASGKPVVATPVNGIPYEMKQPENGFLVKHSDIQGFKEKINKLLDGKKLRNKISKNNIAFSKKYDWEDITKKTLEIYKSLQKHI